METKYWNMIDDVVDTAALLAEDKPVAKAIIGTINGIVESQAEGVTNADVMTVIKAQAASQWNDLKDADFAAIAAIIGKDVKLELKTDVAQKDTGWVGKLWSVLSMLITMFKPAIVAENPKMKQVLGYVEVIVQAKDVGISNADLKATLISMSKSAWNSLDTKKVNKIMKIITKK